MAIQYKPSEFTNSLSQFLVSKAKLVQFQDKWTSVNFKQSIFM